MPVSVFVSQYTRQIAHELDDVRSSWLNRRENFSVLGTLPPDFKMMLPTDLNHADFLGDKENLHLHHADAAHDQRQLETYLTQLRQMEKEKVLRIHGRPVTRAEFEDHRDLIIRQRDYYLNLARRLKAQVKRHNIMHCAIESAHAKDFDGMPVPPDVEIMRQLSNVIRRANKTGEPFVITEDVSFWLKQAEGYMGKQIQVYLEGSSELYPDDVNELANASHKVKA